ncbi:HD domain-containing protein [Elusimicrobiota bacterium]
MLNRTEALHLIAEKVKTKNLLKHMLAVESCMKELALYFNEDQEVWGMAGLLHDIDYDDTKDDFSKHGNVSADFLRDKGVAEDILNAIRAHAMKKERDNTLEKALYAVDPLTGLIVACALMHPSRKIRELDVKFVQNRFREKRFAAGAYRDQIMTCETLGLSIDEFITICLEGMKHIDSELGL